MSYRVIVQNATTEEFRDIPITLDSQDCTYHDVKLRLDSHIDDDDYELCFPNNDVIDMDEKVQFNDRGETRLKAKLSNIFIDVQHNGLLRQLEVEIFQPIDSIVQRFRNKYQEELQVLSHEGKRLDPYDKIRREFKDGDTLMGLIKIVVSDENTEKEHPLWCNDFDTIEQVMRRYCDQSDRYFKGDSYTFKFDDVTLEYAEQNGIPNTLFNVVAGEGSHFFFQSKPFEIVIQEKDDSKKRTEVEVYEHDTIQQVKLRYSEVTFGQGLDDNDKLEFKGDVMDEDKYVYQYKIQASNTVFVNREDIAQIHTTYVCADCGSDVRLKKYDLIMCRSCGYRIVFKVRVDKPCQYIAR